MKDLMNDEAGPGPRPDAAHAGRARRTRGERRRAGLSHALNGKGEMRSVKIDPNLLKPDDVEMVEDLVMAAFQDAKSKVEAEMQKKMQDVTGGLPLPPGLKLF